VTTIAREKLHAFYASHPDIENADGEQLLALPEALTAELHKLLAAACHETVPVVPIVIDPATGIREFKSTFPSLGQCFYASRSASGRYVARWDAPKVVVTGRGHWYRQDDVRDGLHNDTICRGCGHHGHFDYILDYKSCAAPATAQDVVAALSGPARHVQPGDRVRVSVDDGGREYGKLLGFYRVDGVELADVDLDSGRAYSQTIEHLTAA
jgi:hypothetical protein